MFITVVSSGIFFRWTRALFRGHAVRRACPTRKGSACDFGRGRRACSWGEEITTARGGQGKSFRSARLGSLLIGSVSVLRSERRWVGVAGHVAGVRLDDIIYRRFNDAQGVLVHTSQWLVHDL